MGWNKNKYFISFWEKNPLNWSISVNAASECPFISSTISLLNQCVSTVEEMKQCPGDYHCSHNNHTSVLSDSNKINISWDQLLRNTVSAPLRAMQWNRGKIKYYSNTIYMKHKTDYMIIYSFITSKMFRLFPFKHTEICKLQKSSIYNTIIF